MNVVRVQYMQNSLVIHDWNLFGCIIIHSEASHPCRCPVFLFNIFNSCSFFHSYFCYCYCCAGCSFSSPFSVSIFGILIVVLCNVRVQTQQFQSIYYTHSHCFSHPSIHPSIRSFWSNDEKYVSIHLFFNRSLCTNWAKSIIDKRSDEILHITDRLCKYNVMVLAKHRIECTAQHSTGNIGSFRQKECRPQRLSFSIRLSSSSSSFTLSHVHCTFSIHIHIFS